MQLPEHLVAFLMGTMVGIWWAQAKRPESLKPPTSLFVVGVTRIELVASSVSAPDG